jgi:hypothetical protein
MAVKTEAEMAQLIAKCRLTGHYMYLGIDVATDDMASMSETIARKYCPFCSCEHAWFKRDAKLLDKSKQRRPFLQSA